MPQAPRVVFLANDAVFEQGLAFLESFRVHNPTMRLSMIPFAADIERFKTIRDIYQFDILDLRLERWDELAKEFFPGAEQKYMHRLRKLSIFDMKASATIYLDLDTVVLKDISFIAEPIRSGEVDFICTATGNDPWVYNESYKLHRRLQHARRFSDGFFAFNPEKLNSDLAYDIVLAHKPIYLDVRATSVYCQPVTNFIVDMLGLKVAEVFALFENISPQVWHAEHRLHWVDNRVVSDDGKDVLFIHWAGPVDMAADVRFKELFDYYLNCGRHRISRFSIGDEA